ncbi:hypothetical protein AB0G15_31510 [Streptosporangium sp. NPDC023825]|uniref:hypothetical protein n=1 Tax=Streptosporangium sp. NPDC023825 TaxID=3154909 RepID=UPI00343320AE
MNARTAQETNPVIRAAVRATTWAPSVHNTQPWSSGVDGDEIALRADSDRKLRVGDPGYPRQPRRTHPRFAQRDYAHGRGVRRPATEVLEEH